MLANPVLLRHFTADEFLLIDHHGLELVEGRVQEKNMGAFSSTVGAWIFGVLLRGFDWQKYGFFLDAEGGYQCWPRDRDRVRKPDISFVHRIRLPGGLIPEGWCPVPPDFAIEILSKNDTVEETEEKVAEYLEVGVPLVWIVDPKQREVHVYRGTLSRQTMRGQDELQDDDILPGFRCLAQDLFPPTGPAA
jgi:Uma2 family endonuclease